MHELSLCRTILDLIHDRLAGHNCRVIKKITLEIGQLAAVDIAALRFAFAVISKGSKAEAAILEIIIVEGQARCNHCQQMVKIANYYDACRCCGEFALRVTQGDELRLKCMEVT